MDFTQQFQAPAIFIHLASLCLVFAYTLRNPIHLRLAVIIGQTLFVLFYLNQKSGPIWEALFWNSIITLTNIVMIAILLRERTLVRLSEEEKALYPYFDTLSPGEFRKVLRKAEWGQSDGDTCIIQRDAMPDHVYFLLDGDGMIVRPERTIAIRPGTMLGEIAFLLKRPATATVTLHDGARFVRWAPQDLHKLMDSGHRFDIAFRGLFNRDLALKIALG